jgi:hypothetical protein
VKAGHVDGREGGESEVESRFLPTTTSPLHPPPNKAFSLPSPLRLHLLLDPSKTFFVSNQLLVSRFLII